MQTSFKSQSSFAHMRQLYVTTHFKGAFQIQIAVTFQCLSEEPNLPARRHRKSGQDADEENESPIGVVILEHTDKADNRENHHRQAGQNC